MLLVLTACTSDENGSDYSPELDILFSPAVNVTSRASEAVYPQDTPFGVWAYSLPQNEKWSSTEMTPQTVLENARVTHSNGKWEPTPSAKWPGNDRLTFFAYAPYDANMTFTKERGVEFRDFDVTSGMIPMYTPPVTDCSKQQTNGCVALPFIQTLAKVEINVCSAIAHIGFHMYLKSVTIDDIAFKGSFQSLPQASWKQLDERKCVEFCDEKMEVGMSMQPVGVKMLIPQMPQSSVKLTVDIYDNEGNLYTDDYELTTEPIKNTWNVGKYYVYNIVLSHNNATFNTDIIENLP